jgi:hypothetical protein
MNKRQALAQAQKHVHISGRFTVIGPHRNSNPSGPYTEVQCATYAAALDLRTAWVANLALAMMGVTHEDVDYHTSNAFGSASQRMTYALARLTAQGVTHG